MAATDFYERVEYLEKTSSLIWPEERLRRRGAWWSVIPDDVVVVGTFGRSAAPNDVVALTCAIAAAMGEYRKRIFQNEDGTAGEVPVSSFPRWVKDKLAELAPVAVGSTNEPRVTYT